MLLRNSVPESKLRIKEVSCLLTIFEGFYSLTECELLSVGELENIFICIPGVLHFFINE